MAAGVDLNITFAVASASNGTSRAGALPGAARVAVPLPPSGSRLHSPVPGSHALTVPDAEAAAHSALSDVKAAHLAAVQ